MKLKKILAAGFAALTLFSLSTGSFAAGTQGKTTSEPFQMEAESIEYNAKTGQMLASGSTGVKLVKGTLTVTGIKADYNTKTQAGIITGGVTAIQEDATMTAAQVETLNANQQLTASGNVVLKKGTDSLYAPKVDYYSDRKVAVAENDAKLVTADGVITADRLESFFNEKRTVAQGNVKINSEQRKLQASADHAVHYGPQPGEQAKIVLTGNARATQDGNTIVGQTLTLYMDDKAIDAAGRTKVVIASNTNQPRKADSIDVH